MISKIAVLFGRLFGPVREILVELLEFIGVLFEKYKAARRLLLVWVIWEIHSLIGWYKTSAIDLPANTKHDLIIGGIIGLLTIVVGFYQWSRKQD